MNLSTLTTFLSNTMSNLKPKKSIADYGGVVAYLNATADEHGGLTGDKFVEYVSVGLSDPKIVKQAKDTISASTVKSWRRRLK